MSGCTGPEEIPKGAVTTPVKISVKPVSSLHERKPYLWHRNSGRSTSSRPVSPLASRFFQIIGLSFVFTACGSVKADVVSPGPWSAEDYSSDVSVQPVRDGHDRHNAFHGEIQSLADFQRLRLVQPQPPARVVEDFHAVIAVRSSVTGLKAALRMVLPHHIDPRSGKPLVTYIAGDHYRTSGADELLSASGSPESVEKEIRRLRTELHQPDIDSSGAYFDGCALLMEVHRGRSVVHVEVKSYGPVVTPSNLERPTQEVGQIARARVRVERDSLFFEGEPFFLTMVPDHGESAEFFQTIGINSVWTPELDNASRQKDIRNHLLVVATPPHPQFDPATFDQALESLPPLDQRYPVPDVWYLGTGVLADQQGHLAAWGREVRSADRILRRPLMADVASGEDLASRQLDILGISHCKPTGKTTFGMARNIGFLSRQNSAHLTFPWEWVNTEAPEAIRRWRNLTEATPIHIEPEQILIQVLAALSSGARGVGYWKSHRLDGKDAQCAETAAAIELSNSYITILQTLLLKGQIDGHLNLTTDDSSDTAGSQRGRTWVDSALNAAAAAPVDYRVTPTGPDATIINAPGRTLALVNVWNDSAQFVPAELHMPKVSMTVAATETSSAAEVSLSKVTGLQRKPIAGGLQLDLNNVNIVAIAVIGSDPGFRKELEGQVHQQSRRATELLCQLAASKSFRTQQTVERIEASGAQTDHLHSTLSQAGRTAEIGRAHV